MTAQHDPAAQRDPAAPRDPAGQPTRMPRDPAGQHDPAAGHRPVGMVGTGNMGGRMTRRMVEAGHAVLAVDADPARIPACGATQANSLAELAERCDVIMLSLPDSPVIEAVIRNPGGLLEHARDGQVIVDLSTANPASTRALHDELAGRGVRYLDAGISGGAAGAEQGTLTLMVGGDETALAQVKPLLDTFSAHVHHMGGSGTGHVTKVLNNFLNGVTLAATAEVMVAGKKAGLDLAQLLDVINTSTGVSFASLNRFPHIIKGDYLEGGLTGRLMAKDVRLYLDLAEDLGVVTLVGPGTLAAFQVSNALGYGDQISNRVVDAVGDLAGGVRVADQAAQSAQQQGGLTRMHVSHGRSGQPSEQRTATFTGTVHMDPVLTAPGVMINTVIFTPGARTHWHRHPGGQLLVVTAGRGIVATRAADIQVVTSGDVVWAEPGEEHWHGACDDSLLTHMAVSHGTTEWAGEVADSDYTAAQP